MHEGNSPNRKAGAKQPTDPSWLLLAQRVPTGDKSRLDFYTSKLYGSGVSYDLFDAFLSGARLPTRDIEKAFATRVFPAEYERALYLRALQNDRRERARQPVTDLTRKILRPLVSLLAGQDPGTSRDLKAALQNGIDDFAWRVLGPWSEDDPPRLSLSDDGVRYRVCNDGSVAVRDVVFVFKRSPRADPIFEVYANTIAANETVEVDVDSSLIPFAIEFRCEGRLYLQNPTGALVVPLSAECLIRLRRWFDVSRFLLTALNVPAFSINSTSKTIRLDTNFLFVNGAKKERGVSSPLEAKGFEMISTGIVTDFLPELILMSDILNRRLTTEPIRINPNLPASTLSAILKKSEGREVLGRLLESEFVQNDPRQELLAKNEEKLCLASDVVSPDERVSIVRESYYHGSVTIDLVSKIAIENGEQVHPGAFKDAFREGSSGEYILNDITLGALSYRLGASTLLVTSDRKIVFKMQESGKKSIDRAIPSGSGSCDWKDWVGAQKVNPSATLSDIARITMERELFEELLFPNREAARASARTVLIAYFRWLAYGGQPQFIGLTRVDVASSDVRPDGSEARDLVSAPNAMTLHAGDSKTLQSEIDGFLKGTISCSVPLWVALSVLRKSCNEGEIARILGFP